MRILQVNSVYGRKSTGLIVRDIDQLCQTHGIESYAAYRDLEGCVENGIRMGNKLDGRLHAFRTRLDGKQGYGSFFTTKAFLKKVKRIKPDVIHLHNIHSNFLNLSLLVNYAKKNKIPVILTLHDCWYFTGKCYHFADIGCEKWKTGCGSCPKRKKDIPSYLLDSSASVFKDRKKLFDYEKLYVVGCSQWISSLASQSPILEKAQHSFIYNGIDTAVFTPKNVEYPSETDGITIITMANKWFEEKNQTLRERIFDYLKDGDRLTIIGCSEMQKDAVGKYSNVTAYGYLHDRAELAEQYARADVFLNVTHIDTLPTVNMESLSCGTPVITYDAGGSGELVSQGRTGYVVPPDDVDAVITALDMIRNRAIDRNECRQYAIEHFDKKMNYEKYIDLYRSIEINEKE